MAQITVTGTIKDSHGVVPISGQAKFELSNPMLNSSGVIIGKVPQFATVSGVDGTFSIVLESTTDATPGDRVYYVSFVGVMNGQFVTNIIGSAVLTPTPSTQTLDTAITITPSGNITRVNHIRIADQFPGANAGQKIAAAIADLPSTGGTVDARGLEGAQVISVTDPFSGVTKAVTLQWPSGVVSSSIDLTIPSTIVNEFTEVVGGNLSMASGKVATINGPIVAGAYQIFAGAGTVDLTSNKVQKILWVEWWGAKGDNATNSTSAISAAFTAVPHGGTVRFASNNKYQVMSEISLDHKFQVTLLGNDSAIGYADPATKPEIVYKGGASAVEAALRLNNCYACTVQGLIISSNDAIDATKGAVRGVYITFTAGGYPSLSSRNKLIGNTINANTSQVSWIGVDINNGSGANNEHHSLIENLILGYNNSVMAGSGTGINLGHSQVKAIELVRNNISNVSIGVSVQGSLRAMNNSFNTTYTVWSLGYLVDPTFVFGDDIETCYNYISTNQHPGGAGATFIGNRVNNISANGDNVDDYWIKTVGKFTFIDNSLINDSQYNIRAPGPFTFQGDGASSAVYFENNTIQGEQFGLTDYPFGLETMMATVVNGSRVYKFGGTTSEFGTSNQESTPTDYITRKTINLSGAGQQAAYAPLYVGDNDITVSGLYQEYGLTVTVVGTPGATTYKFAVVGVDATGRRSFTSLGTGPNDQNMYVGVTTANATLSGSNYLKFTWPSQKARPPATWSIYEINPASLFQWRPVVTGLADSAGNEFQTTNVIANWAGSFVTRPFLNETSDVGIPGRFVQPNSLTFTDADTTPSVGIGNRFVVSNTGATNVTTFDDGSEGQIVYLRFTTANTTLKHGSTLKNRSAGDVTPAAATIKAYQLFSSVWYEQF